MEGVWRGSHVDCATSWYCATYKVKKLTHKCLFLTACLPWVLAQTRNRVANSQVGPLFRDDPQHLLGPLNF